MLYMLSVQNLDLFYGDAQALNRVSLEVPKGEIVAIVGANGAGKSSLIRSIAGIEKPRAGKIVFKDREIQSQESHIVCNLGIGQVAEGRLVFPTLTVAENLEMGAMLPRARAHQKDNLERVLALFPRLHERIGQAAGTLSGGEQQMLALGRAMMAGPKILLLDEPTLGLAPIIVNEIAGFIRRICDGGVGVLLAEQNAATALSIANRAYVLQNGQVAIEGTASEVANDPEMRRAYLGL